MSTLRIRQWHGSGTKAALARFARAFHETTTANPELFLPVACLFVWQVTAITTKPSAFAFALLLTLLLLIYGYRVLGKTEWLRRLGWVPPRQGFWFYSLIAGVAAAASVWWIAPCWGRRRTAPFQPELASASGASMSVTDPLAGTR